MNSKSSLLSNRQQLLYHLLLPLPFLPILDLLDQLVANKHHSAPLLFALPCQLQEEHQQALFLWVPLDPLLDSFDGREEDTCVLSAGLEVEKELAETVFPLL